MECDFAFLCDFAEQDRKLHAVGIGWETIQAPNLPHRQPNMGIVARLRGSVAESGTKDVSVRLIDADGEDVIQAINQQLKFEPRGIEGHVNLVVQLTNVQFKSHGSYAVYVTVGGEQKARLSFSVIEPRPTGT
jgi:uncharacterized protein DUF6941